MDAAGLMAWQIWWHKSSNKPGCDCFRNLFLTAFVFDSQYSVQDMAHHAISCFACSFAYFGATHAVLFCFNIRTELGSTH